MPQLSLYLDDQTMANLRNDAGGCGMTLSKFVASLLKEKTESRWPEGYWSLFGALDDDSFVLPDDIDLSLEGAIPCFD